MKTGLKEKVKSVPKQLVRRGLDDGTERLRASSGILPSVGRPMTTAATGSKIPLLAVRGGLSVALNVESRPC